MVGGRTHTSPRIPTGRGNGLKTRTVWVRIPPRAPRNRRSAAISVRRNDPELGGRPQSVRSNSSGLIESVRDASQVIGEQVPISVQRQGCRLVAQERLKHLHIGPRSNGQTCARMPQLVRRQPGLTDRLRRWVEHPPNLTLGQVSAAPRRNSNSVSPLSPISVSSSGARNFGTGTVGAVWFFVAPSTGPPRARRFHHRPTATPGIARFARPGPLGVVRPGALSAGCLLDKVA